MKNLLLVVFLLVVGVAGLGFYRGWFQLSTNSVDQKPSASITVDNDKIHADEQMAKEKMQGLGRKMQGETPGSTTRSPEMTK